MNKLLKIALPLLVASTFIASPVTAKERFKRNGYKPHVTKTVTKTVTRTVKRGPRVNKRKVVKKKRVVRNRTTPKVRGWEHRHENRYHRHNYYKNKYKDRLKYRVARDLVLAFAGFDHRPYHYNRYNSYYNTRYNAYRAPCVSGRHVKRKLRRRGFRDFHDFRIKRNRVGMTAVRPNGMAVRLVMDRCSGAIIKRRRLGFVHNHYSPRRYRDWDYK